MFIILLMILSSSLAIDQHCNYSSIISLSSSSSSQLALCPLKAHCLPNNKCACDEGYIGDCSQQAFHMKDLSQITTTVKNNQYSYFQIIGDDELYTELSFILCHQNGEGYTQSIAVWKDDGQKNIFVWENSEPGGKIVDIREGCMSLSTPFILFGEKPNGETQGFILGLKLTSPGQVKISLKVTIDIIDFRGVMIKLFSVIGGCFLLVLTYTIGYLVYKWGRRELIFVNTSYNKSKSISHFEKYLPMVKISSKDQKQLKEQICSVCLLELTDSWIRKTPCSHLFHQECLDEWCKTNLSCPICRNSLEISALKYENSTSVTSNASELMEGLI